MGLGYLLLSVKSEQDKYLTGNPQFTYFKAVYRKHTNFVLDNQFVNFVGDLELVGSRLESTRTAYENAYGKLVSGRGNLIKRAEEMKTLGAKTNKSLPDNLLEIPQIETKDSTI